MKIKFKDGTTLEVLENDGEDIKEIHKRAVKAMKAYEEYKNHMKSLEDDLGEELSKYQEWVDYDMKRFGKISNETMREIAEAGLTVVKDKYGDWEVIAHEPIHNDDSTMTRTFDPNVSFSIQNIKSAIKEGNQKSLDKELWYVNRDIDTDLNEENDYVNMYTPTQLNILIDKYKDVVTALKKASPNYDEKVKELEDKIAKLEEKFKLVKEEISKKEEVKEEVSKKEEVKEEPKVEEKKVEEVKEEVKEEPEVKVEPEIKEEKVEETKTEEKVEEIKRPKFKFLKKKETKDTPPPFYDPTVSVKVDVDYRKSNIERAGRHKDQEALKVEYPDVIASIEEDLDDPKRGKYFRKDELRKVTDEYYYIAKIYEDCGLVEEANEIKDKTNELYYNVWHLGVR